MLYFNHNREKNKKGGVIWDKKIFYLENKEKIKKYSIMGGGKYAKKKIFGDYWSYSNAQKTGLVAHELGHAMGLSHQPDRRNDSIMYNYDDRSFADGTARNRPAKRDCNNINHIYN